MSSDNETVSDGSGAVLWVGGILAGGIHLAAAVYYVVVRGLSSRLDPVLNSWDSFWQHLPIALLRDRPFESLWNLHAQPPLFNVVGWLLHGLACDWMLPALHGCYLVLGTVMAGMTYGILFIVTRRPWVSLIAATLIALNPALFLFEAFGMYTFLTAFLVVSLLFVVALHQVQGGLRWMKIATVIVVLLVLCQSTFHLAILVPVVVGGCLLTGRQWRVYARFAVLVSLIPLAWYAKNAAVFGFFGASSWAGSNVWRIASADYTKTELLEWQETGLLDPAAAQCQVFARPSVFKPFGFDRQSDIPSLANDDYHNINMVEISRMHMRNAWRLIRAQPRRYGASVRHAYYRFCGLSYATRAMKVNRRRLSGKHLMLNEWMHGLPLMARFSSDPSRRSSTLYVAAIPLCFLLFGWKAWRAARFSPARWLRFFRAEPVYGVAMFFIALVTLVSIFCEYGENCRFKFAVEIPILVCLVGLLMEALEKPLHLCGGQGTARPTFTRTW